MKTEIHKPSIKPKTILMRHMEPCEIGYVRDEGSSYNGRLVMRTASLEHFEIMDLTAMSADRCWTEVYNFRVELITEPITITFTP